MNQKQLEIFVNLAETLNFTRTAEQLYLAQTTVSLQIRSLEEELQVQLFERTSRNVKLTYAGSIFLDRAKNILDLIQESKVSAQEAQKGYRSRLTIGFADDTNASGLSRFLRSFSDNHPDIRLQVHGGYPDQLLAGLTSREYDLIFSPAFRKSIQDHYYSHELGKYRTVAAFNKDHPFSQKKSLRFRDFEGQDYIYVSGINEELVYSSEFYHRLLAAGVHVRIVDRVDNIDTVFLMLNANLGVTVLLDFFTERFSASSGICIRPIEESLESSGFNALWRKEALSEELKLFTDYLQDYSFQSK